MISVFLWYFEIRFSIILHFLFLRETHNALQLLVFSFYSLFLLFCLSYPELLDYKLVFLILKIFQYGDLSWWVQLFSRYPCKNWYNNWYLHFYKSYDHQMWQTDISTGVDSIVKNQAGAGDVITSRSCDRLKALYLHYQCAYGNQTWQDDILTWPAP